MKTNRAPFSDICELISVSTAKDADGYDIRTETEREVFCSISAGVSRTEMYEALKAGIKLSATAEVWEADYNRAELLEYEGIRYRIVRCYPSGYGTLELSLEEVVH